MKKLSLTFLGDVRVTNYGVYLNGEPLENAIRDALLEDDEEDRQCLAHVNMTIEPVKDTGLSVEVKEV